MIVIIQMHSWTIGLTARLVGKVLSHLTKLQSIQSSFSPLLSSPDASRRFPRDRNSTIHQQTILFCFSAFRGNLYFSILYNCFWHFCGCCSRLSFIFRYIVFQWCAICRYGSNCNAKYCLKGLLRGLLIESLSRWSYDQFGKNLYGVFIVLIIVRLLDCFSGFLGLKMFLLFFEVWEWIVRGDFLTIRIDLTEHRCLWWTVMIFWYRLLQNFRGPFSEGMSIIRSKSTPISDPPGKWRSNSVVLPVFFNF